MITEQDAIFPVEAQEALAARAGAKPERMMTSRSPFLSKPDEVADIIERGDVRKSHLAGARAGADIRDCLVAVGRVYVNCLGIGCRIAWVERVQTPWRGHLLVPIMANVTSGRPAIAALFEAPR